MNGTICTQLCQHVCDCEKLVNRLFELPTFYFHIDLPVIEFLFRSATLGFVSEYDYVSSL